MRDNSFDETLNAKIGTTASPLEIKVGNGVLYRKFSRRERSERDNASKLTQIAPMTCSGLIVTQLQRLAEIQFGMMRFSTLALYSSLVAYLVAPVSSENSFFFSSRSLNISHVSLAIE